MNERPVDVLIVGTEAQDTERIREAFALGQPPCGLAFVSCLREARDHLERHSPDLVISELRLPDGRAEELLPAPDAKQPYPLLIMADPSDQEEAASLRHPGLVDHVVKSPTVLAAMPRIAARVLRVWDQMVKRRRLEDLVRQSEEHLEQLLDDVPVGYLELDANGRITRVNRPELEMLGYNDKEMLGRPASEFIAGPSGTWLRPESPEGGTSSTGKTFEAMARRKDGTVLPVRVEGRPLKDAQGRVVGLRSSMVDITELRRAEQASEAERDRLHAVLDAIPILLYMQAPDYSVRFANRTFCETFCDPKGRKCYEVLRDRTEPCDECETSCAFHLPAPHVWEWTAKNGKTYLMHSTPVTDADGSPLTLVIGVDITERKQAEDERQALEAQVRHAQKMESLGVLAGGIAHDFNNLLVGILGNTELALMDLPSDSPAVRSLEQVEIAAQRAADLTNLMLAYSGKGKLIVQPLNLSRLVEEMGHLIGSAISKKISLRYHVEENLPAIEADATQIRQVVMNLIINAAEAIGGVRGEIVITSFVVHADREDLSQTLLGDGLPEGCYVCLEITDNGIGMDAATRAKIFDPFFTTKVTGRGLGLAAVLGIVRSHGGTIAVDSTPGEGTTFRVLLPCSSVRATDVDRVEDLVGGWIPQGTVLVVDDEPHVASVAGQILLRHGLTVLTCSSGQEAVETFRKHADEIVAVLLDLTMPDMSGEEVLHELRRIRQDVRVILSSGYHAGEISERFGDDAPADFVHKPYRAATLLKALHRLLRD